MAKEVWVVTYTSQYDDIYTEAKVCSTEAKALQELADYVRDIHESVGSTDDVNEFADEGFRGKYCFEHCDDYGHKFLVEATKTEII